MKRFMFSPERLLRCAVYSILLGGLVFFSSPASAATTRPATLKPLSEVATSLGEQVHKSTLMRADLGADKSGRPVLYSVLMGRPAVMVGIDVATAKVTIKQPLPGTSGAWSVKVSADGTVYLGAYNQGLLYCFMPKTGELKNLGFPFKTRDAVIYPMDTAPDGKMYGGVYPSGHAFEFDPATEKLRDLGDVTNIKDKERWPRATVVDAANGLIYFGVGNEAELIEYNLKTGERRDLLPPELADITSVYDLNLAHGKLIGRKEVHEQHEYFVLDAKTGRRLNVKNADTGETSSTFPCRSRGMSPVSPVAAKVYYTREDMELCEYDLETDTIRSLHVNLSGQILGSGFVKLDEEGFPGYTLVGVAGMAGWIFKYNLETGKLSQAQADVPAQPMNLHRLATGPDGSIYCAGYLGGNAGMYNPETMKTTPLVGISQSEGMVAVNHHMFFGLYPDARMADYDTSKPWNMGSVGSKNPQTIFQLGAHDDIVDYVGQDRMFAMAGSDELGILAVGTVPKNNQYGGVLAVYDVAKQGDPEIYLNVVKDQSIVSLAIKGNVAYGGSSIVGGLGGKPRAKEAVLFGWDLTGKKKLFEIVPAAGEITITALLDGPDGNIWGLANKTLFLFDPITQKVVYKSKEFPTASDPWIGGSLLTGADGMVYGTNAGVLFKVDPATRVVTQLCNGARMVARDKAGKLYVIGDPVTVLYTLDPAKLDATGTVEAVSGSIK